MHCSLPPYLRMARTNRSALTGRLVTKASASRIPVPGPPPAPAPAPPAPPEPDPNAAPPAPPTNYVDERGRKWGFPANTAVEKMTDTEAKEYWREKSKKHEKHRKPEDWAQIEADAQAFRAAQTPPGTPPAADAATLDAARLEAAREARSLLLTDTFNVVLRSAAPHLSEDEVEEIIDDLDLNKFTDQTGRLDMARVTKLAEKHAAKAPGSETPPQTPGDPLAQALASGTAPGTTGSGAAGSITSLREQAREQISPKKKS